MGLEYSPTVNSEDVPGSIGKVFYDDNICLGHRCKECGPFVICLTSPQNIIFPKVIYI